MNALGLIRLVGGLAGIVFDIAYAIRGEPIPGISRLPVSTAKDQRSRESTKKTTIQFVNDTGVKVNVMWIDFAGERVQYKELDSGGSYEQETFLTHPWIVVEVADGKAIALIEAVTEGKHTFKITR